MDLDHLSERQTVEIPGHHQPTHLGFWIPDPHEKGLLLPLGLPH